MSESALPYTGRRMQHATRSTEFIPVDLAQELRRKLGSSSSTWRPPNDQAAVPDLDLPRIWHRVWQALKASRGMAALQRKDRRMAVKETVSLGEKRFVSILEVDGRAFLIGGGASGVSLLSTLPSSVESFEQVLNVAGQEPEKV